jgi:hypothetical protein
MMKTVLTAAFLAILSTQAMAKTPDTPQEHSKVQSVLVAEGGSDNLIKQHSRQA